MSVLKELINEFAIFSTPTPDEDQITTGDDTEDGDESQGEVQFSVDNDGSFGDEEGGEEDAHDPETCKCPCHDHEDGGEEGIEGDPNIEVVEPEDGDGEEDEDGEFNLDDEDEDGEDKFKLF